MNDFYDDKLAVLGLAAGAFVLIVALGTLVGLPWSTAEGAVVGAIQTIGVLLAVPVAAIIVLITQGYDLNDLR
jgi:hypothetical protein